MDEIFAHIRVIGEWIGYFLIAVLILWGRAVGGGSSGRNRSPGRGDSGESRGRGNGPYRYDRSSQELYERNLRSGPDNH